MVETRQYSIKTLNRRRHLVNQNRAIFCVKMSFYARLRKKNKEYSIVLRNRYKKRKPCWCFFEDFVYLNFGKNALIFFNTHLTASKWYVIKLSYLYQLRYLISSFIRKNNLAKSCCFFQEYFESLFFWQRIIHSSTSGSIHQVYLI
jgi:hypothetical protein